MNNLKFTKSRVIFLIGLAITVGAILYTFKSSDKLQAVMLIVLGLLITSGALIYVLVKSLKQMPKATINNDTASTPGSIIFAELIESLAYMFFM